MSAVLIPVAIIAVLILLNGIFVAAEFAIVAAPHTRIAQLAGRGQRAAGRVLAVLREPARQNRYLATAQVGITIVSLGLGMYGEHTVADWLLAPLEGLGHLAEPLAHTIASILALALLTYLHVVVGEMVPKSLALQFSEPTVLRLAGPMAVLERLLLPIVGVLNAMGNGITRLLGIPPLDVQARLVSPQELEFIVEESSERGLIEPAEQLFIENIFDLHERTVGQVMTPRTRVVGLPVTASQEVVLRRVCQARYSRYPIYSGDLDHVIGVLHIKDLARQQVNQPDRFELRRLMRPVVFVPETLPLEQALFRFQRENIQVAIVLDEFGGTAGLVALEDLLEEVVGEIQDEFDREQAPMEELGPGLLRVRGDLILDELNQHYDLKLEHAEADTIGGLVMAELGRIARPDDVVTYQRVVFEVEAVAGLAVQTVLVRLPAGDDPEEGD